MKAIKSHSAFTQLGDDGGNKNTGNNSSNVIDKQEKITHNNEYFKKDKKQIIKSTLVGVLAILVLSSLLLMSYLYLLSQADVFPIPKTPQTSFSASYIIGGVKVTVEEIEVPTSIRNIYWRIETENGEIIESRNLKDALGCNLDFNYNNQYTCDVTLVWNRRTVELGVIGPGTEIIFTDSIINIYGNDSYIGFYYSPTGDLLGNRIKINEINNIVSEPLPTTNYLQIRNLVSNDRNLSYEKVRLFSHTPLIKGVDWQIAIRLNNSGKNSYSNITFLLTSNLSKEIIINTENLEIEANGTSSFFFKHNSSYFNSDYWSSPGYYPAILSFKFLDENNVTLIEWQTDVISLRIDPSGALISDDDLSIKVPIIIFVAISIICVIKIINRWTKR